MYKDEPQNTVIYHSLSRNLKTPLYFIYNDERQNTVISNLLRRNLRAPFYLIYRGGTSEHRYYPFIIEEPQNTVISHFFEEEPQSTFISHF